MELFNQVRHALEGEETEISIADSINGPVRVEIKTFGPDRWIEKAQLGRIDAINFLAIILFAVRLTFDPEAERRIVNEWAAELRAAAKSGEITPRNLISLLPIRELPDDWDWLVSLEDADAFVKNRGMSWTCTEVIAHLAEQCAPALHAQRFPPELFGNLSCQEPAPAPAEEVAADEKTQASDNRGRPPTKMQTEIDAVLASLARNRFDPLALPVGKGKQAGAKRAVWQDVGAEFTSRSAFNSRWKQMKECGFIADAK